MRKNTHNEYANASALLQHINRTHKTQMPTKESNKYTCPKFQKKVTHIHELIKHIKINNYKKCQANRKTTIPANKLKKSIRIQQKTPEQEQKQDQKTQNQKMPRKRYQRKQKITHEEENTPPLTCNIKKNKRKQNKRKTQHRAKRRKRRTANKKNKTQRNIKRKKPIFKTHRVTKYHPTQKTHTRKKSKHAKTNYEPRNLHKINTQRKKLTPKNQHVLN